HIHTYTHTQHSSAPTHQLRSAHVQDSAQRQPRTAPCRHPHELKMVLHAYRHVRHANKETDRTDRQLTDEQEECTVGVECVSRCWVSHTHTHTQTHTHPSPSLSFPAWTESVHQPGF